MPVAALLASIPSPHTGVVHLGPLTIHMYGLTLLVAILAAVGLTGRRWTRMGGDWDLVVRAAIWGVAFGVVGARAYHDITSWNEVPNHWWGVFAVWSGGLGIWGAIPLGVLAGGWVVKRSGASVLQMMDAAAPGLLLAQGIGRWGNWWNQELFGGPTNLPWGLQIDPLHRPLRYLGVDTFQPTFLYEFCWDLLGVALLLWLARRVRFRAPALFAAYVSFYTFGRTFEELLRVDPSHHFLGFRLNFFVSIGVFLVSTAFLVWWQLLRHGGPEPADPALRAAGGPSMAIPKGRVRPSR